MQMRDEMIYFADMVPDASGGKDPYGDPAMELKLSVSDGELRETQMTNYFSNLYPIDCAVLSVNAQSYRKYGTLPAHEFLPEI